MTLRTTDFYAAHLPKGEAANQARIARAHADNAGWYFSWQDDQAGDHSYLEQTADDGSLLFGDTTIDSCEVVTLHDERGTVLDALGCIDNANQDYRDLVEAELALEAMGDDSECGHCGSTWNSVLTPTPAARCPFEYDHEPDDDDDDVVSVPLSAITDTDTLTADSTDPLVTSGLFTPKF